MIDARELRIGNWVQPAPNITDQPNGKVTQVYMEGFTVDYHYPGTWYQPIPLTEDILNINCGLSGSKRIIDGVYAVWKLNSNPNKYGLYVNEEWTGTTIEYLHQLQNLYYCLIGKELEINL